MSPIEGSGGNRFGTARDAMLQQPYPCASEETREGTRYLARDERVQDIRICIYVREI